MALLTAITSVGCKLVSEGITTCSEEKQSKVREHQTNATISTQEFVKNHRFLWGGHMDGLLIETKDRWLFDNDCGTQYFSAFGKTMTHYFQCFEFNSTEVWLRQFSEPPGMATTMGNFLIRRIVPGAHFVAHTIRQKEFLCELVVSGGRTVRIYTFP